MANPFELVSKAIDAKWAPIAVINLAAEVGIIYVAMQMANAIRLNLPGALFGAMAVGSVALFASACIVSLVWTRSDASTGAPASGSGRPSSAQGPRTPQLSASTRKRRHRR